MMSDCIEPPIEYSVSHYHDIKDPSWIDQGKRLGKRCVTCNRLIWEWVLQKACMDHRGIGKDFHEPTNEQIYRGIR